MAPGVVCDSTIEMRDERLFIATLLFADFSDIESMSGQTSMGSQSFTDPTTKNRIKKIECTCS